jgi:hypothetical protein
MRGQPGPRDLLGDVASPGAPLHREIHVGTAGESAGKPVGQMRPVCGRDLPPRQLAGIGIDIVERQLLPVNVQSSYDGYRNLLKLPGDAPNVPYAKRVTPSMMRLS